jgi:hypothetical protein
MIGAENRPKALLIERRKLGPADGVDVANIAF